MYGQYAPLSDRSSVAPHSTLPQHDPHVFLGGDLRPRPDYFAYVSCSLRFCARLRFVKNLARAYSFFLA